MPRVQVQNYENYPYRVDIYNAINDRLDSMVDRHCKVFNPRFNLQFPEGYKHNGGNAEISQAMNMTAAALRKKGIDYEQVWVREKSKKSDNPHYHISAMLDGSKMNNVWAFKKIVDEQWYSVLGIPVDGLQHIQNPDNNYENTMIRRPSSKASDEKLKEQERQFDYAKAEALKAARYMAKTHTKGDAPANVREWQGSQIKKKV